MIVINNVYLSSFVTDNKYLDITEKSFLKDIDPVFIRKR